jgi:hypothetical protein
LRHSTIKGQDLSSQLFTVLGIVLLFEAPTLAFLANIRYHMVT